MTHKPYSTRAAALAASSRINAQPRAVEAGQGGWWGVGEDILCQDGTRDCLLVGQRNVKCWSREVTA